MPLLGYRRKDCSLSILYNGSTTNGLPRPERFSPSETSHPQRESPSPMIARIVSNPWKERLHVHPEWSRSTIDALWSCPHPSRPELVWSS